jgi:hypothetical protein
MEDLEEWPTIDAFNDFNSFSKNTDEPTNSQEISQLVKTGGYTTKSRRLLIILPWLNDHFIGLLTMPCEPQIYDEAIRDPAW